MIEEERATLRATVKHPNTAQTWDAYRGTVFVEII